MDGSTLKWHGGKVYLASRIIAMMPPHLHYCEPYFGGGAVLFAKNPDGVSEVVNDINLALVTFWRVLRDPACFPIFQRMVEATPFCEQVWEDAALPECCDDITLAHAFFVRCRQSLAGRMKSFTGVTKTRTRRRMNNEVSAWLTAVEGLSAVHERLKQVLILNRPALDVIRFQDGEQTLFYVDPPYLRETRTAPDVYAHEMTHYDHAVLLNVLGTVKGKFILSGYPSALYQSVALRNGWRWRDFDIANHAAGGSEKRRMTERLIMNYDPPGN